MAQRPNILYIHSHDTGRYIQPYGYPVPTPNLQRLAEEGVLFRQAFCAAPTCSPSRAALLTGQSAHSSGMLGLAHRGFSLNNVEQHLQHTLQMHGYFTVLAGLQHIVNFSSRSWEDIGYSTGLDEIPAEDDLGREDRLSTAHLRAAAFLEDAPPEPFFLNVGFLETHRPFYDPNETDLATIQPPRPLPDAPETRQDMSAFIETARVFDNKVGTILEALEKSDLSKNTLVICTTDHGIPFPYMKCNLTDHGTGVMLILRDPHLFSGGRAIDAMVSHIDLFPTLCDYLGIEKPDWLQGQSLLPVLRGELKEVNEYLFGEVTFHAAYEPQRMVRTQRYKYIRRFDGREHPVLPNIDNGPSKTYLLKHGLQNQPRPEELLFDLIHDPNETNNLVDDPNHRDILYRLRETLQNWMEQTDDPLLKEKVIPMPEDAIVNDPDSAEPNEWETISNEEHIRKTLKHLKE
jgi:arylsulfatase A-like enzyme